MKKKTLGRPQKYACGSELISLRLPADVVRDIREWAEFLGISFTDAVVSLLSAQRKVKK